MLKDLEEMFRLARKFLLKKGRSMLEDRGMNPKGDVTKGFDLGSEDVIINYCRKKRLPVEILTEERGTVKISNSPKYTLVLDPVDGSVNFARGIELVGFSIAALPHGKLSFRDIEYGLIGNVFSGTVLKAEKGRGAFRNNKKIAASRIQDLSRAMMIINISTKSLRKKNNINKKIPMIANRIGRTRSFGSASIDFSYVADGSADICINYDLTPENFAAAYLIIKEAGGILTDNHGNELPDLDMRKGYNIIASANKELHEQILKLVN